MTKRNQKNKHCPSKIDRIERKCDRILSELLIIRQRFNREPELDMAIERLHRTARRMRAQAKQERDYLRGMFNSKSSEL